MKVLVGMYDLLAESMFSNHCSSSICSVGLPLSPWMVVSSGLFLNIFQSDHLYTDLGVIGKGVIIAIMGMWWPVEALPDSRWVFR